MPFGGAGPLHGVALAELLGASAVLVPPSPGVLCAEGLLVADLKAEFHRTVPRAGAPDAASANALVATLHAEAETWLDSEQVPQADRTVEVVALMRYEGQGGELAVPWVGEARAAVLAFHAAHAALYDFSLRVAVELVTLRVEAAGRMPAPVTHTSTLHQCRHRSGAASCTSPEGCRTRPFWHAASWGPA